LNEDSFIPGELDASALEETWQRLHAIPEPGFEEVRTSRWIESQLTAAGFSVRYLGKTGLLASLEGRGPGPSIALRADMDALSFRREDGTAYCSHACGHDAHCTMVLSAGKYFAVHPPARGTLYLLFQPGEETMHGAREMLRCGLPHLDGMLGIHLRPRSELPLGRATPALLHCASIPITARFRGRASHAARPQLGINAVSAAARAVTAVDEIRLDRPGGLWSAKATVIDSQGNLRNVIPEFCSVSFDLRAETNDIGKRLTDAVETAVRAAAHRLGCTAVLETEQGFAPEYDPQLTELARLAITDVLGVADPPLHTPGSEDFHAYSALGDIPTAYIGLGADLEPGLHSPQMHFDHACMSPGTRILIDAVNRCLQLPRRTEAADSTPLGTA
jgi:amidohydrolase